MVKSQTSFSEDFETYLLLIHFFQYLVGAVEK
jgi:hypothetical protein